MRFGKPRWPDAPGSVPSPTSRASPPSASAPGWPGASATSRPASISIPRSADRLDRHAQFALVAGQQALRDADLRMDREPARPSRCRGRRRHGRHDHGRARVDEALREPASGPRAPELHSHHHPQLAVRAWWRSRTGPRDPTSPSPRRAPRVPTPLACPWRSCEADRPTR